MADGNDLSGKVGLDTTAFKKGVMELTQDIRAIETGFRASAAVMGDWAGTSQGLTTRIDSLSEKLALQKQKLAILTEEYKKTVQEQGSGSKAAEVLANQLYAAEKAINSTEKELKQYNAQLDDMDDQTKKIDFTKLKEGMAAVGSGAVAGLKAAGAALAAIGVAAGAAAISLGKEVVKQFGELEQNLGGSEAVFGEYADSIQKTGEDAYKNLGLSQSDYLATANKMGALFQGSGIEQQKSLELTERAMQRAADMASVMGIDMSSAMEAVTGAAKGNFTMMDNLGVAMNATSIQAYAASKGLDFVWNSATNAEKAEVAMQMFFENTEQYAGNFAKESTQTISGSIGLLQASLSSFTAGLGNASADMTNLTQNLVDAFQAVVQNIVPVLKNVVTALPAATGAILSAVGDLLPTLLETVTELFSQVLATILDLLPRIIPALVSGLVMIIGTITGTLKSNGTQLIRAGMEAIKNLITGLLQALPEMVTAAIGIILALVDSLSEQLPALIPVAVQAILTLLTGIITALPQLLNAAIGIIMALIDGIMQALPLLLAQAPQIIISIVNGLLQALPMLIKAAPQIIVSVIMGIINALPELIAAVPQIIVAIITGLIGALPMLLTMGPMMLKELWEGLKSQDWGRIGADIISGIVGGFKKAMDTAKEAIKEVGNSIKEGFEDFFGIESPSKLMRDAIGKNLALGIGQGFTDNIKGVVRSMTSQIPTSFDIAANVNTQATALAKALRLPPREPLTANGLYAQMPGDTYRFTQYISSPKALSPSETARHTRNLFQQAALIQRR